jgi:Na+/melibiose symporter-like transporter
MKFTLNTPSQLGTVIGGAIRIGICAALAALVQKISGLNFGIMTPIIVGSIGFVAHYLEQLLQQDSPPAQ